jgi:fatty acid desaturase
VASLPANMKQFTILPSNPFGINKTVAFLAGLFHLYAPTMFRELHFTHHRHTHEPGLDPEISIGGKAIPSVVSNLPFYLSWVTGLPLLMFKIVMLINGALFMPEFLRKNLHPFVDPKVRFKLALESIVILSLHLGFIYLALYIHEGFWALFTAQVVGHCFLACYTTAEHNGLPHEGNIFEKTRSVKSGMLTKFLMWNMPYHAEHHAYPAVPFHALPQLHNDLKDEIKHNVNSRAGFHLNVLRDVTIGSK